ncbi:hypothetical protein GGI43DRAFT_383162 [Trichoderma evansii]
MAAESINPASLGTKSVPQSPWSFGVVKFKHPDYPESKNCFLSLPRTDIKKSKGSDEIIVGVHHKTARVACEILTGNNYEGYFSHDRQGDQSVDLGPEDLLTEDEYFFFIKINLSYPLVPTFQDWIFPHDKLERIWPDSPVMGPIVPGICSFTFDWSVGTYLVPLNEALWYVINRVGMGQAENLRSVYDASNIIPLRSDLRKYLNDGNFAIVPKLTESGMRYVMTVLSTNAEEIWPTYHGCTAYQLSANSKPGLFARFAWTVFARANTWIGVGDHRTILRRYKDPRTKKWFYTTKRVHISESAKAKDASRF